MLVERMIRAARLDRDVYYELERDRNANGQAFLVVLMVVACRVASTGPSGWLHLLSPYGLWILFNAALSAVGGWLFWSFIAMLVGARFGGRADFEQVMRPLGFAHAPGVLSLFAFVPGLGIPLILTVWVWILVATVIAVREAMRFDTWKAVKTVVLTTVACAVIDFMIGLILGTPGFMLTRFGL